jgi:hypothetical protein
LPCELIHGNHLANGFFSGWILEGIFSVVVFTLDLLPYCMSTSIHSARPLDLTITTRVKSLRSNDIKEGLKNQMKLLTSKGFTVSTIFSDGGFNSLTEYIQSLSITHDITGADSHAPVIENKIRVIKNRIRSILFSLPYMLPNSLIGGPHSLRSVL